MNGSAVSTIIRTPERWRRWARTLASRAGRMQQGRRVPMALRRRVPIRSGSLLQQWISMPLQLRADVNFTFMSIVPNTRMSGRSRNREASLRVAASGVENGQNSFPIPSPLMNGWLPVFTVVPSQTITASGMDRILKRKERHEERITRREMVIAAPARASTDPAAGHSSPTSQAFAPFRRFDERPPQSHQAPPNSFPAVNLDQITDSVMRQLDRRIDAWRDRTGRR